MCATFFFFFFSFCSWVAARCAAVRFSFCDICKLLSFVVIVVISWPFWKAIAHLKRFFVFPHSDPLYLNLNFFFLVSLGHSRITYTGHRFRVPNETPVRKGNRFCASVATQSFSESDAIWNTTYLHILYNSVNSLIWLWFFSPLFSLFLGMVCSAQWVGGQAVGICFCQGKIRTKRQKCSVSGTSRMIVVDLSVRVMVAGANGKLNDQRNRHSRMSISLARKLHAIARSPACRLKHNNCSLYCCWCSTIQPPGVVRFASCSSFEWQGHRMVLYTLTAGAVSLATDPLLAQNLLILFIITYYTSSTTTNHTDIVIYLVCARRRRFWCLRVWCTLCQKCNRLPERTRIAATPDVSTIHIH